MQTIAAPISGDYDAKGESLETLIHFHNGDYVQEGKFLSNYTFAFHFVFPILGILLVANLLHHLIENNKLILLRTNDSTVNDMHSFRKVKISTVNMIIYLNVICCFLFVVYVITLDCIGLNKRIWFVQEEIYHPLANANKGNESVVALKLEYGIPGLMLAEDLLVLYLMLSMCVRRLCSDTKKCHPCEISCYSTSCKWFWGSKKKWYNIIMGPISCLLIHSYHIMVGFIHTPHHATSMLVFYALMIVTFILTLKAAYFNLIKLYQLWYTSNKYSTCFNRICRDLFCFVLGENGSPTTNSDAPTGTDDQQAVEGSPTPNSDAPPGTGDQQAAAGSPTPNSDALTGTDDQQAVDGSPTPNSDAPTGTGKKQAVDGSPTPNSDAPTATGDQQAVDGSPTPNSDAGSPALISLTPADTVDQQAADGSPASNSVASENGGDENKCVHICALASILFMSIITSLVFVYIAFLFILVPINNVIDEAPERILSINQTVVILFGAAITYKIYQDRKFETFLDYLVRAATKMVTGEQIKDGHFKNITKNDWEQMSRNERRKEVAYVALNAMYRTANVKLEGQFNTVGVQTQPIDAEHCRRNTH